MKKRYRDLPRRKRIALNLLAIVLLTFLSYTFWGGPPVSVEQRLRRAEQAHMVGPGKLLGTYYIYANSFYEQVAVADTGDGVIFYQFSRSPDAMDNLVYREKTGDLSVFLTPDLQPVMMQAQGEVPLFLFDRYPQAVLAEVEFTLSETFNGVYSEETYLLEAQRNDSGLFVFFLESPKDQGQRYAIQEFSRICGYSSAFNLQPQPVTVRLYDEADGLILEEVVLVRCVAGQLHEELGTTRR